MSFDPIYGAARGEGLTSFVDPAAKTAGNNGFRYNFNPVYTCLESGDKSAFIDPLSSTSEANGIHNHFNPVYTYAQEGDVSVFVDPLASTSNANGVKFYFNPVYNVLKGDKEDNGVDGAQKIIDPATSSLIANITDDKETAETLGWVLNPIGKIFGKIFG